MIGWFRIVKGNRYKFTFKEYVSFTDYSGVLPLRRSLVCNRIIGVLYGQMGKAGLNIILYTTAETFRQVVTGYL